MTQDIFIVNGERIAVERHGDGPALLYLHGAGGHRWTPLHERLAARFTVIAPQHPGFGGTGLPGWLAGVGDLALFYLDMLDAMSLEPVHLMGHSLGGWIAADLAIRNSGHLRSLGLLSPAGVRSDTPFGDILGWTPEEIARRTYVSREALDRRLKAIPTENRDITLGNTAATERLAWNRCLYNPQLSNWLHRIRIPTLLVWGKRDQITPFACAARFESELPDVRLVELEHAGHALPSEFDAEVASAFFAFAGGGA